MEILKKIIADKEAEYKKIKREKVAFKQLLKMIKENPEVYQKINEWAFADYMRVHTPKINGKNEYDEIHSEAHAKIEEIFGHGDDLSQVIWTYKFELKKQIEKDIKSKAKI